MHPRDHATYGALVEGRVDEELLLPLPVLAHRRKVIHELLTKRSKYKLKTQYIQVKNAVNRT